MAWIAGTGGTVPALAGDSWRATVYSAVIVESEMIEVPLNLSRNDNDYRLVALALARRMGTWGSLLEFEAEGQVAKYIRGNDHLEVNVLGVTRWARFPWDRYVDTSFAFGAGLSFASAVPRYEHDHFRDTNKVLAYVLWELDFGHPRLPAWRLVTRIHHRSGAYGTFNGVYAGSNAVGVGFKADF